MNAFVPVYFTDGSLALNVPLQLSVSVVLNLILTNYNLAFGVIFSSQSKVLSLQTIVNDSVEALYFSNTEDLSYSDQQSVYQFVRDKQQKVAPLNILAQKRLKREPAKKSIRLDILLNQLLCDKSKLIVQGNEVRCQLSRLLVMLLHESHVTLPIDQFLLKFGVDINNVTNISTTECQNIVKAPPNEPTTYHVLDSSCPGVQQKVFVKTGCPMKQSTTFPMFYEQISLKSKPPRNPTEELEVALARGFSRLLCCKELYSLFLQNFCFVQLSHAILVLHCMRRQGDNDIYSITFIPSDDLKFIWNALTSHAQKLPWAFISAEGWSSMLVQQSLNWSWWDCMTQPANRQQCCHIVRVQLLNPQPGSVTADSTESSFVIKLHSTADRYRREVHALQQLTQFWKDQAYALSFVELETRGKVTLQSFRYPEDLQGQMCARMELLLAMGAQEPRHNMLVSIDFPVAAQQSTYCGLIIMRYGQDVNKDTFSQSKILQDIANTFYALQAVQLCHTDIRLQNILYFPQWQQYQLIDYDRVVAQNATMSISEELQFRSKLPLRIQHLVEQWHREVNDDFQRDSIIWTAADDFKMLVEAIHAK